MTKPGRKIILAVTGASGALYAQRLLAKLTVTRPEPEEIAVIFSETALHIWEYEIGEKPVIPHSAKLYDNNSFFTPFASGSTYYDTMIICPASMGTIGRIAGGTSDDLITRAADVILKEKRKLILVPREAPYNLIHIRNMETLTLAGAILCPASPSFYSRPAEIKDLVDTIVCRVLRLAGFDVSGPVWMENND
ncbi:MAG: UbiX family flavin prenyltransferase [Bacteroidales bacterium]